MNEEKRKSSVISHNFSRVFEIKKEDFLKIVQKSNADYVNYSFILIFDKI